jgi:phosphatidylserine/phosphatidylglycerophosphate/cardiolipin synthase-like enzyme
MTTDPTPLSPPARILEPGRNCWTADAPFDAAGLLIDGRDYFRAFYHAARQARRHILLAGWRYNSDVRLLRGRDAEKAGGEVRLLPFLKDLCERNPELRIYVLAWDFSFNYSMEWELFQERKFEREGRGRIRFRFDAEHPVAASHHDKWVVIDGRLAFVGGMDFSAETWDDRRHPAHDPDRRDSGDKPHGPHHDIQAVLTGPACRELTEYFRRRWRAAGGGELDLAEPTETEPPVVKPTVPIAAPGVVAFSRTCAQTAADPTCALDIVRLYRDAIAAADELIYLENQYFSSQAVFEALTERLKAPGRPKLDVVLVLPKRLPSWVEAAAMGPPRLTMLDALRQTAEETGHRLGLYGSASKAAGGEEVPVLIHSKLLAVDDRFLTVGSANASNRSMGLDTELNVSWEAAPRDRKLARSIRDARAGLLAEHCGLSTRSAERRELRRRRGLVGVLDRLADDPSTRLRRLTREGFVEDRAWLETLERWGFSFDPGKPASEQGAAHERAVAGNGSVLAAGFVWFREWVARGGSLAGEKAEAR